MNRRTMASIAIWLCSQGIAVTAAFSDDTERDSPASYQQIVMADDPTVYWRFDDSNATELVESTLAGSGLNVSVSGNVRFAAPGPQRDEYPLFAEENRALEISGAGYVRVADPGPDSILDFGADDAITLEAWVNPDGARSSGYAYVIGKGRTENAEFAADNQNYALRLALNGGNAGLTFLFRSAGPNGDWHRWTSESGLPIDGGWHHVAVTYTFGQKNSVQGYIDGESVPGIWDMGGATDRAPVVDDDEVWIGSSMGGRATSTLQGSIDEVAIYRTALSAERIAARFRYVAMEMELDLSRIPADGVLVDIFEGIPDGTSWRFRAPKHTESYETSAFALVDVPNKYSDRGIKVDRSSPFLVRAMGYVRLPESPQRMLVRCRNASRLYMDNQLIAETAFHNISASGHGRVYELDATLADGIRPLQRGDTQNVANIRGDGRKHLFRFEMIVGGRKHRPEFGETSVSLGPPGGGFRLLSPTVDVPLTNAGWQRFATARRADLQRLNSANRREASAEEDKYWEWRHELAREYVSETPEPSVPADAGDLPAYNAVDRFLNQRLTEAGESPTPLTDDWQFLRRATLDAIGTIPTREQIDRYFRDDASERRILLVDRLLASDGWADNWVGYWQDVLAENPNIVNPTLNNTGPFRWWIHESFLANKPFDRFATELVMMEGSAYFGGPAGFGMATQNDAPMAAKAHIVGQAFMALEMKCARCHDAPYHEFKQRDLFSLAALLKRSSQEVPKTSTIPGGDTAAKSLLVEVTLKPGEKIAPKWSFPDVVPDEVTPGVLRDEQDTRERLAALITSARNQRFARVIVNRLWKRYLGRALVEPVDDWEYAEPSHPELLDYLARELVLHDYDLKHVARLILTSHAYQRAARGPESAPANRDYLFASPLRRRMSAEQLVDSLFVAAGKTFDAGLMCIDIDGARPYTASLNLGEPTRGWQFASLSNERDRPSLALPFVQPFVTFMETFGWRSSRQDPLSERNDEATVLQPAVMANGILSRRITRLSDDSALTAAALRNQPVDALIDEVYQRLLTRQPTPQERVLFTELLDGGYGDRIVRDAPLSPPKTYPRRGTVSWSNHLNPEANVIKSELEVAVREGDPPSLRLTSDWRERMEDMTWTLLNSPEFVFLP